MACTQQRPGAAEFVDHRLYKNDERLHVGINGYARLTFTGPRLTVAYVDVHGDVALTETFAARDGAAQRTGVTNHLLSPAGTDPQADSMLAGQWLAPSSALLRP